MATHGGDIYDKRVRLDFSVNINPLGMPEGVKAAAKRGVDMACCYPDIEYRELRKALADSEGRPMGQIVCGNGAAELIYSTVRALNPRKAVLMSPGFAEYEEALMRNGCRCEYYELSAQNGFMPQADYMELLDEQTDMIWICNPHNPTGTVLMKSWIKEVLDECRSKNIIAVVDECFMEFVEDAGSCSAKGFMDAYDNLLILKAFTKVYAMPGLRLGYLLGSDEVLIKEIEDCTQPWNISLPAQMAGVAALQEVEYLKAVRILVGEERMFLKQVLRNMGLRVYGSHANYVFFRAGPGWKEKCLEDGMLIRDCSDYRGLDQGFYRISVKRHEENLELLAVLERLAGEED